MAKATIVPEAGQYAALTTNISIPQVSAVLELILVEECTVPFITRYRKEKTGGLDEEQIRAIHEAYDEYNEREKRRAYILETITKMEKMTPELNKKIMAATSLNQLEDIYAPFKAKKKTKGQMAIEAGLQPLAELIKKGELNLESLQSQKEKEFLNPDKKIKTWDDALAGAQAIITEEMSHDVDIKDILRKDYWASATLASSKRKKAEEEKDYMKYKDYFEFSQPVKALKDPKNGHRFLAMRRGMTQKVLKVEVSYEEESALGVIKKKFIPIENIETFDFMLNCAKKALTNSIHPSLDLEIKSELKKVSDEGAIDVFGINLKNLLLQPYLGSKAVIALDPGVRTGCKTVVVDATGKLCFDTVVYPHVPQNDIKGTTEVISRLIEHFNVEHIAIGNGTFGRETLSIIEDNVKAVKDGKTKAVLVNEAGASIYSASPIAKKEFPDKDATVRGAISIARRFQDPLAELVKIDPKSIGVGQYQHDVNQAKLKKSLDGVVESCVNFVGVDINTASAPLLSFISGIGPSLANNIVKKREGLGGFKKRDELLKVSRFTPKIFEQSAGFLRIYNGENPLDGTFIHPEQYDHLSDWAKKKNLAMKDLVEDPKLVQDLEKDTSFKDIVGEFTHDDIIKSLRAPSQDPRTEFKSTEFRKDIRDIKDLTPGEWYTGIVTNITKFGAFIDVGIKENGLVHVSEMADHFVSDALEVLKVGQEVKTRVIEVDLDRKRIALSLKTGESKGVTGTYTKDSNKSRGNNQQQAKIPKTNEAPLKNNAFAALKNLKL
tara:strand:+ start:18551 stop:20881 length:2331 start_codon:yes stop_codon:yes gene_type:complete